MSSQVALSTQVELLQACLTNSVCVFLKKKVYLYLKSLSQVLAIEVILEKSLDTMIRASHLSR